jgi:hypothetical protein
MRQVVFMELVVSNLCSDCRYMCWQIGGIISFPGAGTVGRREYFGGVEG